MDSQLISILIGIVFVVGVPMLEKLVDKIKHGVSVQNHDVRRQQGRAKRAATPKVPGKIVGFKPIEQPVEGERVTADMPAVMQQVEPDRPPVSRDELRKAIIWSEILNNPKFKDN